MILFATKAGTDSLAGFPYALELARSLRTGLAVLIIRASRLTGALEEAMMAAAFAEAGDIASAREILQSEELDIEAAHGVQLAAAKRQCGEAGVDFAAYAAAGDDVESIRDTLKLRPGIEMVLLSPSLGAPRSGGYLKRILTRITKPVVAISQQARANA
ncbi:MAG TPA: hypothetical protein VI078_02795 [bacterium]